MDQTMYDITVMEYLFLVLLASDAKFIAIDASSSRSGAPKLNFYTNRSISF